MSLTHAAHVALLAAFKADEEFHRVTRTDEPSSSKPARCGALCPGARVVLVDLKKSELNGLQGKMKKQLGAHSSGRAVVELDDGREVLVGAANLGLAPSKDEEEPTAEEVLATQHARAMWQLETMRGDASEEEAAEDEADEEAAEAKAAAEAQDEEGEESDDESIQGSIDVSDILARFERFRVRVEPGMEV